jgi:hypothetical protein
VGTVLIVDFLTEVDDVVNFGIPFGFDTTDGAAADISDTIDGILDGARDAARGAARGVADAAAGGATGGPIFFNFDTDFCVIFTRTPVFFNSERDFGDGSTTTRRRALLSAIYYLFIYLSSSRVAIHN